MTGSRLLLSVNRFRPAVRRRLGLGVWTARLPDDLVSAATHLGLLRPTPNGVNAAACHRALSIRPRLPVHSTDVTSRLCQVHHPVSDGAQQPTCRQRPTPAAAVSWRTC